MHLSIDGGCDNTEKERERERLWESVGFHLFIYVSFIHCLA